MSTYANPLSMAERMFGSVGMRKDPMSKTQGSQSPRGKRGCRDIQGIPLNPKHKP